MDWTSITFGAFLALVVVFAASSLSLAIIMRQQFLLWMAARCLTIGLLALTFEPAAGALYDNPVQWHAARVFATDLMVSITGPLLATYIGAELGLKKTRILLWSMLPIGVFISLFAGPIADSRALDWLHDLILASLVLALVVGLTNAVRAGSRRAAFQAGAWAPSLAIGFVAFYFELVRMEAMPFYAQAMLIAFSIEFVVTSAGIGDGLVRIEQERDEARAGMRAAVKANALDPLTQIANRRGLVDTFANPKRDRPRGLAVIDCDHFKRINDMFGHDVGDEVLCAVAQGLKHEDVFVARHGGEEFVALLYGPNWLNLAENIRRRISISVLEQVPKLPFPITASSGVAEVTEDDTLDSAIKRADIALYAAKDAGRDTLLVHSPCGTVGPHLVRTA
ncbi:GGDEF domain-containing protein [Qipengyuania mesophila]|uniref:GGDEF domain-containing protein n=1 Tax=Qipengyuania mesophila TaxID=2867246 RepID=UPI003517F468